MCMAMPGAGLPQEQVREQVTRLLSRLKMSTRMQCLTFTKKLRMSLLVNNRYFDNLNGGVA